MVLKVEDLEPTQITYVVINNFDIAFEGFDVVSRYVKSHLKAIKNTWFGDSDLLIFHIK